MSSSEPADAPVPAATAAWAALAIVAAVQFMIVLDATVVNVAAPSIQHSLGFTASSLQWIITVYTLLTSGFQLLGGRASDLVGRRLVFLLGTAVFTAASLFNGLAPSATALIVGRGAQGLGAAFASAAGLAVLLAAFPNARDRSRALAVWTSIAIAGGAAGVLVGGVLTQWLSWPWVFYINVPVGALAILASLRWLPESRDTGTRRRFDLLGALTVTAGTLLLVYAITEAPSRGWASPEVLGTGIGGLVLLMLFVLIERRTPTRSCASTCSESERCRWATAPSCSSEAPPSPSSCSPPSTSRTSSATPPWWPASRSCPSSPPASLAPSSPNSSYVGSGHAPYPWPACSSPRSASAGYCACRSTGPTWPTYSHRSS